MPKANKKKREKVQPQKLPLKDFEDKILELSVSGLTAEKIGESLRKQGIHPKEHGVKISKVLKKAGKYVSPDVTNLETKLGKIKIHSEKNRQDKRAMREKDRIFSNLRKIKAYHSLA